MNCPRCNSNQVYRDGDEYDCITCGKRWPLPKVKKVRKPEPVTLKPIKRLRGVSTRESQRLWAKTPAGREARKRYNDSELFRQAHARHRRTEKYKATQAKFREKRELFYNLLYPKPPEICPLGLLSNNGTKLNDLSKCDLVGKDCTFACFLPVEV